MPPGRRRRGNTLLILPVDGTLVAPHTRAVRLMAAVLCAAYAGSTVDGGLGCIEKYWEGLGESIAAFTVSNTV